MERDTGDEDTEGVGSRNKDTGGSGHGENVGPLLSPAATSRWPRPLPPASNTEDVPSLSCSCFQPRDSRSRSPATPRPRDPFPEAPKPRSPSPAPLSPSLTDTADPAAGSTAPSAPSAQSECGFTGSHHPRKRRGPEAARAAMAAGGH